VSLAPSALVTERLQAREIDNDESQRLARTVRRGRRLDLATPRSVNIGGRPPLQEASMIRRYIIWRPAISQH
jgi:hypothetical protein